MTRTRSPAHLLVACLVTLVTVAGQVPTPAHADEVTDLQQQLQRDQQQLAQVTADMASNSAQISTLQGRLNQLQAVLADLGARVAATQRSLDANQARLAQIQAEEDAANARLAETERLLAHRQQVFDAHVRALDKIERTPVLEVVLTAHSFDQFFNRVTDVMRVIAADRALADQLRQTRDQVRALRNQLDRDRLEQASVVAQVAAQKAALDQAYGLQAQATSAVQATQRQLTRQQDRLSRQSSDLGTQITVERSEIDALLAFSQGRIGSGGAVVAPEILSNAWGTYYNQRDARWGNDYVGASSYQVWEIGCLLTDVAMVNTHFGNRAVTPATIALNPANFTSDGLMYNGALNVAGHPANINHSATSTWIHSWLDGGGTVIVGMNISGGTHFVTLTASNGSGDYWMNDPWNANAMHVSFNRSDVTGPIFEAIGYR